MPFQQYPSKGGIPGGNTAARPTGAATGDTYYNGQLGLLEIYDGTNWVPCSSPAGIPTVSVTDVGTGRAYTSGAIVYTFVAGTTGGNPYGYTAIAALSGASYSSTAASSSITLSVGGPGSYVYTGTAYNGFGTSASSPSANISVTTVPQAPTIGSITLDTDVVVNYTLGNDGGKPLTAVKVKAYDGATLVSTTTAATTTSTSVTITGLTVGTAYTFKVFSTNANGDSLDSSASTSITVGPKIDYLVVAGGGAGGSHQAAGGGAGGLRSTVDTTGGGGTLESAKRLFKGVAYTVTVGSGGNAVSGSTNSFGNNGGDSSISGTGLTTITSTGGGGGGAYGGDGSGKNGGSGGGEGSAGTAGSHTPGTGVANQGYAGGYGYHVSPHGGGGGGGAGAAGSNANQSGTGVGGNGGVGVAVSITGSSVYYAGGGGGSGWGSSTTQTPGSGGNGGGGAGGNSGSNANGTAGTANTGGGGGGSGQSGSTSGAGGSGVVIIRATSAATSTTGSPTYTTSGSYHIYKFTGNGSITY